MTRVALLIGLLVLAGCGHREAASCDGRDKRPINLGKWAPSLSLACGSDEVRP